VSGILNGVDYDEWNPATDRYIPYRYDLDDLSGKARNKEALLDLLRMPAPGTTPLIGMVSRLTHQKGIDLLFDTLPEVLERGDVRLVALGSGEHHYEQFMHSLQEWFPGRAVFYSGYSEELAHFIEAAADIFLMPSMYEPCGLNQMYSLRYGTVPVVRNVGGLADTVVDATARTLAEGSANGFSFSGGDAAALIGAARRALAARADAPLWTRLQLTGMRGDFSWRHSARAYEQLYRDAIAEASGVIPAA
jgi:starch synthase